MVFLTIYWILRTHANGIHILIWMATQMKYFLSVVISYFKTTTIEKDEIVYTRLHSMRHLLSTIILFIHSKTLFIIAWTLKAFVYKPSSAQYKSINTFVRGWDTAVFLHYSPDVQCMIFIIICAARNGLWMCWNNYPWRQFEVNWGQCQFNKMYVIWILNIWNRHSRYAVN